jgi:hypothetical protein
MVVVVVMVMVVMSPPGLPGGEYLVPVVIVGVWIVEAHFYMLSGENIVERLILMLCTVTVGVRFDFVEP